MLVTLAIWENPFVPGPRIVKLPAGGTIHDLLSRVAGLPMEVWLIGRAYVGGINEVPRDWWKRVRPHGGTTVAIGVTPKGGGGGGESGGGKDLVTTIGTLALLAGSALISGGLLGPAGLGLFGAAFAGGSFGAQAAALGLTVVGSLALNALAPPPLEPNLSPVGGAAKQTRDIAGVTGNVAQPFEYLPTVLGAMRVSPNYVAQPYTELVDGEVIANAIVGLAGTHKIEDIQLSGAPIDDFDGVEYEVREGLSTDTPLTLVKNSGVEEAVQTEASKFQLQTTTGQEDWTLDQASPENSYPKWHTFKSRGVADEVRIRLLWPQGMKYSTGTRVLQPWVLQFREAGSSTWINGPEMLFSQKDASGEQLRQQIRLIWTAAPVSADPHNTDRSAVIAYGTTPESYQWKPASYFDNTVDREAANVDAARDGFDIYLDPLTYPKGQYEVRIKRGFTFQYSGWTFSSHSHSGFTARFYDVDTSAAPYEVALSPASYSATAFIDTIVTWNVDYPFNQTGLTLIAVRAKYHKITEISAKFTTRCPIFSGGNWNTVAATNNPAALYRYVLTSDLNADPIDETMLDDDELEDWYDDCASAGYVCNLVAQNQSDMQVAQIVASAGWASPRQSDTWGIVQEKDTSADDPVQVFTHRNIRGLTVENAYADLPHAIRAQINDEAGDYKPAEELVYRDGYSAANATRFDSVTYKGVTNRAKVRARAILDLRQLIHRQKKYTFETNIGHLVSPRGTLVALAHDALSQTYDAGWIQSVTRVGDTVTAIRMDSVMRIVAAPLDVFSAANVFDLADIFADSGASGITIQLADGSTVLAAIDETEDSAVLTPVTPISDASGLIQPGLVCSVGRLGTEHRRCKVFSVERTADLNARVVLIDEAPEIHA